MEDTGDTHTSNGSHLPPVSSALGLAMSDWVMEGTPFFERMMQTLHQSGRVSDPMGQLLIFSVIGGYIHHFGTEWKISQDIDTSHASAMSKVMQNPAVGQTVEKFMSNQVTDVVGGMLDV